MFSDRKVTTAVSQHAVMLHQVWRQKFDCQTAETNLQYSDITWLTKQMHTNLRRAKLVYMGPFILFDQERIGLTFCDMCSCVFVFVRMCSAEGSLGPL